MDYRERAREALVASYGIEPPRAIVELYAMALAHVEAQGTDRDSDFYADPYYCFIDRSLQLSCAGPLQPDAADPPYTVLPAVELFEFASPGVDGIQYGFVVHAPELARADYPIAEWDPRGGHESIHGLGSSSTEGLERLLSRTLAHWEGGAELVEGARERLWAFARAIDIEPAAAKAKAVISEQGEPPRPFVPAGWRHELTIDGIGVLAPEGAFGREHEEAVEGSTEDVVVIAERAFEAGHPASALIVLRDALALDWSTPGAIELLSPAMQRAYSALGRPLLAKLLARASESGS